MKRPTSPLAVLRRRRGWTTKHLAKLAGLPLRTVKRIERLCRPTTRTAVELAEVLGCEMDDLFRVRPVGEPRLVVVARSPALSTSSAEGAGFSDTRDG